jgi:hypothetical protein
MDSWKYGILSTKSTFVGFVFWWLVLVIIDSCTIWSTMEGPNYLGDFLGDRK